MHYLLARVVLGATWVIAGGAKLARREPRSQTVADFGVRPRWLAEGIGRLLPWVELTLGLLLLAGQWIGPAAAVSALLLALFSLAISRNLLQGRRVECHCFGQLERAPISWLSVARNGGLLALAVAVLWGPADYLSLERWLAGQRLLPSGPPLSDGIPLLLLALTVWLLWKEAAAAWEAALALANTDAGPMVGDTTRTKLRRWLRLDPDNISTHTGG